MSIRIKTSLIVAVITLIAFALMAVVLNNFLTRENLQQDNQITQDNILQARSIIDESIRNLDTMLADWAEWDDSYNYVINRNSSYLNSNFVYSTYLNNHLNLAAIVDLDGNLLFGEHYQWVTAESSEAYSLEKSAIPNGLLPYLESGSPFLSGSDEVISHSGLISIAGQLMILSSHSIVTSDGMGPSVGTLFFGRYLDDIEIKRIYSVYHIQIEAVNLASDPIPADFQTALDNLNNGRPAFVQTLNKESIAGYSLLTDVDGEPVCILKITNDRSFYLQSQQDIVILTLALLAFGMLMIIAVIIVMERFVVSRVSGLSNSVNSIGKTGDLSSRIPVSGNDEISRLAANLNNMLTNIENSRKLQEESEAFNSTLLKDSPNPIEVTNVDGSIRYVNPALEKITGYSEAQLINRKPPFPWWNNDNTIQYLSDLRAINMAGMQKVEKRFLKPDGSPFWVEITSSVIKQDDKIKYYISNWVDITDRKQVEIALKESENRFREMAELLPELVFEVALDGKILFFNRVAFTVFGYAAEDQAKLQLSDLVAPEEQRQFEGNLQDIIAGTDIGSRDEYTAVRKNGTRFPAVVHAVQIRNNLGQVKGVRGILVDITTQKEIEAELRANEEYTSSLLDNAPIPIIVSNRDTSIRYINPAFEKLTGYSSIDVIGLSIPYPWWTDKTEQSASEYKHELEVKNLEKRYCKKTGEYFWVSITNNPFVENGAIQYFIGNWVDVTERKLAVDALKESEEFSSSLRDKAPYPIMVINSDASIRYANSALEKLTGYSHEELVGHNIPYPFERTDSPIHNITELIEIWRQPLKAEALFYKKSGESFYVDVTSTPFMKDGELNYVLSIWIDITAQKQASLQLEQLYQREKAIREALQLEIRSRTEFTRALVHELKTPLTPILASSELLMEELVDEPLQGLARNVYHGAENMNRRVDEMMDLARGEIGMLRVNTSPVDLRRILEEVKDYMQPAVNNAGQTLSMEIPENIPEVMADEDRVRQILYNLISNSIKYSDHGGQIKISVQPADKEVEISVSDTGRGMNEEEQTRLFQPYYRVEGGERMSGLGLGLALSKALIELQKGRIWVNSRKGQGSTFTFTLPLKIMDNNT
jgi:PAS domain S-box-containing protein